MSDINKPYKLRGFFAIWVENYDPPYGPMWLSPQHSKGHDGWAVSKHRYCSRCSWKSLRRFASWEDVVAYIGSKAKKNEYKFVPVYVLKTQYGWDQQTVYSQEDAVVIDRNKAFDYFAVQKSDGILH
jgi:hypothetical protein